MINENKSQVVWSGLSTTCFISGLGWMGMLWHGELDGMDYPLQLYGLRGCPWLSLRGFPLITRSVFGSGILKVHISLRSMCCICIAVVTRYKTSPMRVTSIYTHESSSLFNVKQPSNALDATSPRLLGLQELENTDARKYLISTSTSEGATVKRMLRPPLSNCTKGQMLM